MAFQQPERLLNHWWSFHLSTFTSGKFSRGQWSSTGGPWDKCSPPSCLRNQIPKNKHWIILTDKNVIFVINKICCCFNGTNCPCVFRSLTLWKKWTRFWECWWMDWQRKACTTVSTWSSHLTTVRYNPPPPPPATKLGHVSRDSNKNDNHSEVDYCCLFIWTSFPKSSIFGWFQTCGKQHLSQAGHLWLLAV